MTTDEANVCVSVAEGVEIWGTRDEPAAEIVHMEHALAIGKRLTWKRMAMEDDDADADDEKDEEANEREENEDKEMRVSKRRTNSRRD